jgi:hypothetical protein
MQFLHSKAEALLRTADEAAKDAGNAVKSFVLLKLPDQILEVVSVQPAAGLVVLLVSAKHS